MLLLFHGKDEFSAHEELATLRASGGFDFNQQTFYGEESDPAEIIALCDTLPFLTERRLVVVEGLPRPKRGAKEGSKDSQGDDERDATRPEEATPAAEEPIAAKGKGKAKKGKAATASAGRDLHGFVQAFASYAPHVPETTTLAIMINAELTATSPLLKAAQQYGTVKVFNLLTGAALDGWMTRRARANDARIAPDAAQELAKRRGNTLRELASEIAKLSAYVGKGGEISKATVEALTAPPVEAPDFALTDALVKRDRPRALSMLHLMLEFGDAPQMILGMIAYQTRTLLQVKSLAERGMGVGQIASAAGMAPFVVEKALSISRQFSFAQLEAAHRSLLDADLALKRSKMTPDMALDLLVVNFGAA